MQIVICKVICQSVKLILKLQQTINSEAKIHKLASDFMHFSFGKSPVFIFCTFDNFDISRICLPANSYPL